MATAVGTGVVEKVTGWALTNRIAGKLTGDFGDLRQLVATMNARPPRDSFGLVSFLRGGLPRGPHLPAHPELGPDRAVRLRPLRSRQHPRQDDRRGRELAVLQGDPYTEGQEYENLFRFRPKPREPEA